MGNCQFWGKQGLMVNFQLVRAECWLLFSALVEWGSVIDEGNILWKCKEPEERDRIEEKDEDWKREKDRKGKTRRGRWMLEEEQLWALEKWGIAHSVFFPRGARQGCVGFGYLVSPLGPPPPLLLPAAAVLPFSATPFSFASASSYPSTRLSAVLLVFFNEGSAQYLGCHNLPAPTLFSASRAGLAPNPSNATHPNHPLSHPLIPLPSF